MKLIWRPLVMPPAPRREEEIVGASGARADIGE